MHFLLILFLTNIMLVQILSAGHFVQNCSGYSQEENGLYVLFFLFIKLLDANIDIF